MDDDLNHPQHRRRHRQIGSSATDPSLVVAATDDRFPSDVEVVRRAPTAKEVGDILYKSQKLWINSNHHVFVAIDLEFTRNNFALIQMCFDSGRGRDRKRHVYLSNTAFPELVDILTSPYLVKLLHGSESNDVPWLLSQIPKHDRHKLFVNFIDTRFIAEYLNPDKKPGLYDVLVRYKIVTDDVVKQLLKIEKSLGHIQHVNWRLNRITDAAVHYAVVDVLHLRDIYTYARKYDSTIIQFRNVLRICFLQRFLNILDTDEVNRMNNYYLLTDNKQHITLNDIGTHISGSLRVSGVDLQRIFKIGWMRPPIHLLLRRIIYSNVIRNYTVMIDKKTRRTNSPDIIPNYARIKWDSLDDLLVSLSTSIGSIIHERATELKLMVINSST